MTLTCRAVRFQLPSLDDPDHLTASLAAHMESCLACQAEAARYRRLQRSLGGLATRVQSAPVGLVANVEARLDGVEPEPMTAPARAARVAAAAGAVVAAAGTVAMVRWMRARSAA
jgi:anti-sigma factor RsiW